MATWLAAGLWGFFAGSALLIGAFLGYFGKIPQRVIAGVMAFGSGVLISTLAFELMQDAYDKGGFAAAAAGCLSGAILYTVANQILNRWDVRHRKRSGFDDGNRLPDAGEADAGLPIAVGALLDGIPESIVIGISLLNGGQVGTVAVIAIFISNIPEGLSSSAGMKKAGYGKRYIFGVWITIAVLSGLSSLAGCVFFAHFSGTVIAVTTAVAAGAILSMIVDTMIPEAFSETRDYAGLVTVLGFLTAFMLSMCS